MTLKNFPSKLFFPALIIMLLVGVYAGIALASGSENAEGGSERPIDHSLSSNDVEVSGIQSGEASQNGHQGPSIGENAESGFVNEAGQPTFNGGEEIEMEGAQEGAQENQSGQMVQVFSRIAGSNFTPRDSDTTFSYYGGGCMQRDSNTGDSWFTVDIQVPDGALIDFLRVFYYDNDGTYDINSELWAFDSAGGTTLIAEADSSGTEGYSSAGSNFFAHTVDNLNESLVVVASIQGGAGSSLALCGVRLRYQTTVSLFSANFLPAVLNVSGP